MNSERIERWNERYRAGEQVFDTPSPLVVRFTGELAPGSALDIAAGPGRNALYLAELGWSVFAVDGSEVAIALLLARARVREITIDARAADLEGGQIEMPVEAFDLVLSCYYFQRSLIPRMKAALRPGGLLIAIAHISDADQPRGTPVRTFPSELRTLFDGWSVLHYREGEPGESCHRHPVAELVARKPA